MLTITTKLDVTPTGLPQTIRIKQYASDFRIVFQLFASQGGLSIESGTTVILRGTKRDKRGWQLGGTRSGSTVTFSGTHDQMQQMTAVAGKSLFEVVLLHGGKELPCGTFILDVQRAAMDADTVNPSQINELQTEVVESTVLEYGGTNIRIEDNVIIVE